MHNRTTQIDLVKMLGFMLRRWWLILICVVIGAGVMHIDSQRKAVDTYTASGTMYVYNGNPNLVNYQYTSTSDLNSAVRLLDTYMVVVRSKKVMDVVTERLAPNYPNLNPDSIASTLSMGSVSETGVLRVSCTTRDPQMSADICNAVLDVAPAEIIRVVNAGGIEIIDYAEAPTAPNPRSTRRKVLTGALAGAALAAAVLAFLFIMNRKVTDDKELTDSYKPPVLASIRRIKEESEDPGKYLLSEKSGLEVTESYAKLRMNMLYTLVEHPDKVVGVTSAIAGEGKSTIAANLAISCGMSGKNVLLIDADMRRATQRSIFHYSRRHIGLSEILVSDSENSWEEALVETEFEGLTVMPAGKQPPNPAEMLGSTAMEKLLKELQERFDLIIIDVPPINIVSDPLALSPYIAGCLFVVRQNYSDHRDLRKALTSAEMTGMNVLGFVFYGEKLHQDSYYNRKYYHNYYYNYEHRSDSQSSEKKAESDRKERSKNHASTERNPVDAGTDHSHNGDRNRRASRGAASAAHRDGDGKRLG